MSKKIIVNISGGLGNQFFQYAFGRYLSIKNSTDLYLNIRSFDRDNKRDFKLPYYQTSYQVKTVKEVLDYISFYMGLRPSLRRYYRKIWPIFLKRYFEHLGNEFDPSFKKAKHGYFYGYWGNEGYFKEKESVVRNELVLREEYRIEKLSVLQKEASETNSVAIHVRRGDYINHPAHSKIFNSLPIAYYKDAVERMVAELEDPVFYIFSDDYIWVRKNLHFPGMNTRLAEDFALMKDYQEFELMRACRHFIIANSTFSWWAAWLANYDQKKIIAPQNWYREEYLNNGSFIPKVWQKM